MNKIQRGKRHDAERVEAERVEKRILQTRSHLITFFFEEAVSRYLYTAKIAPHHKKQPQRALLILWFYCNYLPDLPKQPIRELLKFTAYLLQQDPTILSLPANQFILLLINYLECGGKENLSAIVVMLKAGGKLKVEECLQYMVLAGSQLNMNRDKSLFNLYQEMKTVRKDLAMSLGIILITAEGAVYQKTSWIQNELKIIDSYTGKNHHTIIKSYFAPTFHQLKIYLKTLLDSLRGHDRMDGSDPYQLYPLEEELATSFRNLLRNTPLH